MTEGWHVDDLEPPLSGTAMGKIRADYPSLTDAQFAALAPVPVPLTGATTVKVHIRKFDGTVINRAVVPAANQTTDPGEWSMVWQTGDLSVAGGWVSQLYVEWPGVRPRRFGDTSFQVHPKIA